MKTSWMTPRSLKHRMNSKSRCESSLTNKQLKKSNQSLNEDSPFISIAQNMSWNVKGASLKRCGLERFSSPRWLKHVIMKLLSLTPQAENLRKNFASVRSDFTSLTCKLTNLSNKSMSKRRPIGCCTSNSTKSTPQDLVTQSQINT